MNDEVKTAIDEFVLDMQNTDEYLRYIKIKEIMDNNEEINRLLKEIKEIQKLLVKKEALGESILELEEEYKELNENLKSIPIYIQFLDCIEQLDNMFNYINICVSDITKI